MCHLKTILKVFFSIIFVFQNVKCKIFDGPCPRLQSTDEKFECDSIFDEEDTYMPLAHLPVGDRTINIYHNPFTASLGCLRMSFDCPTDGNLVFMTPRCYLGEINEDVIDYFDCMAILSPITDKYRGARGSFQPSHQCTDQVANYTTNYLVTDTGALVLWGCRELSGTYKGKHSEGAWVLVKSADEKKLTGMEVKEAFELLKTASAKPDDFLTLTEKKDCKCGVCTYGTDCSMPHQKTLDSSLDD